jgi:hypothetical protein
MKKNKDLYWFHSYKVIQNQDSLLTNILPTVSMEMHEEATLADHLYAFERFLQSIGFVLPENSHLDFIENDVESDRDDEITIVEPSNHKNNGTN